MKILLYVILGLVILVGSFLAYFFFVFLKAPALDVPPSATEEEKLNLIDDYLEKLHKDGQFNGAVLLGRNHEPLLMKTYGYTNANQDEKLTTESSFRLASVSKQFTAAGILRAQELGLLDIDLAVSDYLEGFPYPNVSIRRLLNQTSGVPDNYMRLAEKNKEGMDGPLTISNVARLVAEAKEPLMQKPGEGYAYSNTNYVLLAGIIEAVSGKSYEAFLQEELFKPLGMQHTRVWNLVSPDKTFPGKTESFDGDASPPTALKPGFLDGVAGDGAVFSSISDFLIWDRFWAGNDLINDDLLKQAFQPVNLPRQRMSYYGFGWVIEKQGFHWHNGAWLGARTYFARNSEKKTALVLLDNSQNLWMDDIARKVGKVWRGME